MSWRNLKTISNYGFAGFILCQILEWHNSSQLESVMYDPVAKAYWLRVKHFYELMEWTSFFIFFGCMVAYWIVEYIQDRRNLRLNRGYQ